MSMDSIIEKWFSTRDQKITWGISLAFFIIFPIYFANLTSFLPDGAVVNSGDSVAGNWNVKVTENIEASDSDEVNMDNDEIFELEFTYDDMATNLAYVEITVSHDESNERGPAGGPAGQVAMWPEQCDTVDVALDMAGINGYVMNESTTESTSSACPSEQILRIYMIQNYSDVGGEMESTKNEIMAMYDDGDQGRGDWFGEITLTVNTGSGPGPSGPTANRDNGEVVTIEWKVVSVEVEITAVTDTTVS